MYRSLKWVWGILLGGLVVNLAAAFLFQRLEGHVLELLFRYDRWILFGILTLGILTYWARLNWHDCQAQQYFALFKPAIELLPADVGFQILHRGESPDPRYRPFYPIYIPRTAVLYHHLSGENQSPLYTESALAQTLREGNGFILLGPPLNGKSRTLYEIVKQMNGYTMVMPFHNSRLPSDSIFSLLKRRRVVVLLEELNDYIGAGIDLQEFCHRLDRYAQKWIIAATCRDGAELKTLQNAVGIGLRRFYENIPLKLGLLPLSLDDKATLTRGIGKEWILEADDLLPTVGSITMAESLEAMNHRFQTLSPLEQDVLRALKLLLLGSVLPFTHQRLDAVLRRIFNRSPNLLDCLNSLSEQSFLHRQIDQNAVQPEFAYLIKVVNGRNLENDLPTLADALEEIEDVEGLFYLGMAYDSMNHFPKALDVYDRIIQLRPDFADAYLNKCASLFDLGRAEDALDVTNQLLQQNSTLADAWYNQGAALYQLQRPQEALTAYNKAVQLKPEHHLAWYNMNVILNSTGNFLQALEAVNQALALKPKNPQYWRGKGLTLISIGQYRGALIAFDKVLQIEPNNPEVWCYKGETLHRLGYFHEALAAFDEALRRHPEFPEAWYNKGLTLFDLHINGRVRVNEQAMIWLCRAWKTRQSLPTGAAAVLHDKICKLGHRLEECEEILSRQS